MQSPFVPVQPALHRQDAMLSLPVAEYESRHSRHRDLLWFEYEPAAQLTQLVAVVLE